MAQVPAVTGSTQASRSSSFNGSQDTLYSLAADTGGKALLDSNDLTLGIRNAFELGNPALGMATVLSALPILIPLVVLLIRQLKKGQVEL